MKTITNSDCFGMPKKAIYFTLVICASLFASVTNAQSLATDQPDYAPLTTATISGFGFQVGESVTMHVTYADGSPLPLPYGSQWIVTADANGSFTTTWLVCNCPWASLVATANGNMGSYADVYFTDSGIDFQQAGNEDHPTDPIEWINGIAQQNTSDYFEGMGTPQRIILFDIPAQPGNNHTLTMEHQAVKGDHHAYDFLMSWEQATMTGANIGNSGLNELEFLDAQTCNSAISSSGAAVCAAAQALGNPPHPNIARPSIPDVMGNPPNHDGLANVNDLITCFEGIYGDRYIDIRGNAPITAASIVFTGYTGSASGDNYATYTINWTSAATNIMIKLAGRSAAGPGTCGYGEGFGAGAINGGPYHFKLHQLDGASLGSQDNQLTAPQIDAPPTCDSVNFSGPTSICPNSTGNVYSATVNGCSNGTHNWYLSNNTSGATIVGSNTGSSVTVNAGSACGSFELCDSVSCDEGDIACCYLVNVVDQTNPVFTSCQAGTDLGCNPTIPSCSNVTAPSATDNCGTPSVTCSNGTIGSSGCTRSRTITWTATDACQNSSTCNRTWTWTEDTDAPAFTNCDPGTDLGCNPTVPSCANVTAPSATDACGTPTVTCSNGTIGSSGCTRTRTITWTATDGCQNSSTCNRTWTWTEDTTAPAFTNCTPGTDLGCNPTVPSCANVTAPTATDACGTPTVTCSNGTIGSSGCIRTRTITWTATDGCQNSATCNRTWTWTEDTTAPAFTNCTPGTDLGCNPTVPTCANVTAPSATDACGTPAVTCSNGTIGSSGCTRTRTITWTATDGCQNSSTCQRTWTWTEDTTAPSFTNCTPGTDLGCNPTIPSCANVTAPSATDACGTPAVTCSNGTIGSNGCIRTRTITWTATDGCQNSSTCNRTWTWTEDTTAPAFTNCTPGTDLGCNPTIPSCANVTAPAATDACGTPTVTCSNGTIGSSGCIRTRTITWTATDGCQNSSTCQRTWTWTEDTTAPAFTNCTSGTDLGCNPTVPSCANVTAPSATDACGTPTVTCSNGTIGSSGCIRTRTITWTATDGCQNSSTCTRTWTWTEDTTAPAFTNCTPGTDLGCNPTVPTCANVTAPSATDACGTPTVTCSNGTIGSSGCTRTRTITWTATDGCQNSSTCNRTWTWTEDTTGPVFDCPADETILCGDTFAFGTPTADDACSGQATVIETGTDTTANSDGSTTYCRHWEATDGCGNASNCTQCITVMCVGDLFCGFTQGFWGNAGGHDCLGQTKQEILTDLLSTALVVGCSSNTFTVGIGDYQCVIDRLPGGGPSAAITGTNTCSSIVGIALHSGNPARFRNVLLAQTITLMLNVRYDVNLGPLQIGGIYLTTIGSDGCDSSAVPAGDPEIYSIPQSIIDYLGSNNTVNDLIALANAALCGAYTGGPGLPTIGDINKAVSAFNEGFDECRFLVNFSNTLREGTIAESNYGFSMIAYPNPFNAMTSIDFTADKAYSNVKVEVFSTTGELVATLFNGPVTEGGAYRTNFSGANYSAGVYTYRITTDTEAYFDKLILIK